jgi:hypothetical protein
MLPSHPLLRNPLFACLSFLVSFQFSEETVDDAGSLLVIGQALADNARSEINSESSDLGAERDESTLALRFDLRLSIGDDASGLDLRLLFQLVEDRRAIKARLLANLGCFGTSLSELLLVLFERSIGLGLCVLRLLNSGSTFQRKNPRMIAKHTADQRMSYEAGNSGLTSSAAAAVVRTANCIPAS